MPFFSDYTFNESVNSQSPVQIQISDDGLSSVVAPYLWEPSDADEMPEELHDAITSVLGYVTVDDASPSTGKLDRVLPKAHPKLWWCFASRIQSLQGLGAPTLVEIDGEFEAEFIVNAFASYPMYRFVVLFTSRPYAVLSNAAIDSSTLTYIPETGGAGTSKTYAEEWLRFTDWDYQPSLDLAYAQHGQMVFRVDGSTAPHGKSAPGYPKIAVPKATVKFRWYNIPFEYIDGETSHLRDQIGKVNQYDWYGFNAGTLLYTGLTITQRSPPPVPDLVAWSGSASFSTEKVCSVELMLEYTSRTAGATPPTPANGNWIADGHNLLPFLGALNSADGSGQGFYYTTRSGADSNKWVPNFFSFPFELLFTDPSIF